MPSKGEIEHDSHNVYYRTPVGAAEAGSTVCLGLLVRTKQAIDQVILRVWQEGKGEKLIALSTKDAIDAVERFYEVRLVMPDTGCLLWYYFIITTPEGTKFYGNNAEMMGGMGGIYGQAPPSYQITVYNKGAKTPDWFKHSVMYQIFPDRFCRYGNEIIKKKGAVIHADWDDMPFYYKDVDTKEIVAYDFFGGNLKGIMTKLPYLQELGINVIYLNPVFESESNHHYDTGNYNKIDPLLGTNDDFRELCAKAREMGIRIIIDGVFSHTGSNSVYFNRDGEYQSIGAYQSQESPYYEWYNFHNYPDEYDSWWNFSTLPDVKETTPSYMDFIINDNTSVLHHWMSAGISGWRLDVIDELPAKFTQSFYKEMKQTDPDAVLIGEVWEDASNKVAYGVPREYLCGQEIDAAMNYPFRKIVLDFLLGHVDAYQTGRRLESLRENYPKQNFYAMMNLLGSHDVERVLTLLGEAPYYDGMPAVKQQRFRLDDDHYNLAVARLRMAMLWQMTYPGVPSIYYGDEIAMQGFKDPTNRAPYDWKHGDSYVQDWTKRLIALRMSHPALSTGEVLPLYSDGDVLAYARMIRNGADVFGEGAEDEVFLIVLNRSRAAERVVSVEVDDFAAGRFQDPFRTQDKLIVNRGFVRLELPPLTGQIWQLEKRTRQFPRQAGLLLHITSLPSKYGCGDIGPEAFRFIDFLVQAGQKVWQILPLGPVMDSYSPYQSPSAFAANPMLISLDDVIERGLLREQDVRIPYVSHSSFVDFARVWNFKQKCLRKAYQSFRRAGGCKDPVFLSFCQAEAPWLDDYALYQALKREYKGKAWMEWPDDIRQREKTALEEAVHRWHDEVDFEKFLQFLFWQEWTALHAYAKKKGISIMGDMPIFISQDSADVWAHQQLFQLQEDGSPAVVAGVPPDYFSATGQLWGNPQYDWEAMQKEHYQWWKARFRKLYQLVDIVRVDHFRGFESYWEIDGKAKTAVNGRWVKGPGQAFFAEVERDLGHLPLVAEDLGIITDEVEQLRDKCGYPGMKVLHFMMHFNDMHRMGAVTEENSIVYTGTHDNNTTVGWFNHDLDRASAASVAALLQVERRDAKSVCHKLIEYAYAEEARLAIIPVQDVLGLDEQSRMNTPGTVGINWKWCLKEGMLTEAQADWLQALCEKYQR